MIYLFIAEIYHFLLKYQGAFLTIMLLDCPDSIFNAILYLFYLLSNFMCHSWVWRFYFLQNIRLYYF